MDKAVVTEQGELVATVRNLPDGRKEVRDSDGKVAKTLPKGKRYNKQDSELATLVPGAPERVEVIREVFARFADGETAGRIRDSLNGRGIPGPRGGTWSIGTLRSILQNDVYIGRLVYNRRTESKHFRQTAEGPEARPKNAEKLEMRPEADWIVQDDAFPALVDKAIFDKAQSRIARRKPTSGRGRARRSKNTYLLGGKLRCSHCGYGLYGQTVSNTRGYKTRRYSCGGHHNRGNAVCPGGYSVPLEWIEEAILDTVIGSFEILPQEEKELEEYIAAELGKAVRGKSDDKLRPMRKRRDELGKEIKNLAGSLAKLDPLVAESLGLLEKAKELATQKEQLEVEMEAASVDLGSQDVKALAKEILRRRKKLRDICDSGDREAIKDALGDYILTGAANKDRREVTVDIISPVFSSVVAGVGFTTIRLIRIRWKDVALWTAA